MGAPEAVQTVSGRLATFEEPQHLPKRRASSTKKKTALAVSWPHEKPAPEDLARAGFYYKPATNSPDNVTCFICKRSLDGWEPEDVPAVEHLNHSPNCAWAINVCISYRSDDPDRIEEDPMEDKYVQARRATFQDSWPHETKKGWKCKVKKMVEAGWCYDPSPEYDDGVTCFYCNLSLDGWEPKDDPLEEHRKRSPDCYFFTLVESYAGNRKVAKGKKGRGSSVSRTSRLSTQSNLTTFSEAPSLMSLGDPPLDDESVLTTATTATTASMAPKGRKTKAKPAARGKRTTSGKKAALEQVIMLDDPIPVDEPEVQHVETTAQPLKRTTRRSTQPADNSHMETDSPPRRPTRTKATRAVSRTEPEPPEDESQLQSELMDAVHRATLETVPKPKRGTKRTSDGLAKPDSSIVILAGAPASVEEPAAKPKRGRKPTKKVKDSIQPRSSEAVEVEEPPAPAPKPAPKAKKGKKTTKKATPEPEPEDEPLTTVEPEHQPEQAAATPPPAVSLDDFPLPPSSHHGAETPVHLPSLAEPTPDPDTPTPARVAPTPGRLFSATKRPAPHTSTESPNTLLIAPPVLRRREPAALFAAIATCPALRSQATPSRAPLAAATPTLSPSKRSNVISGALTTAAPWTAADLETVFLLSPSSKALLHPASSSIFTDLDQENLRDMSAEELARRVRQGLSSPEKRMSVQEWIYWNAARGEERLRRECERLVGVFETEGARALGSLEGVECV
ncbi:hypothetical protein H2199_005630 [Coniosporium tulheliwenetii]|uniref:Uncharacterized protein n=1 Tax=Coniosporium tulheliwenetii TaxID=3383036 RepID=A0ACC2Z165_9PEZI|nr:hypothetical protein H2199_005630 [Cladosporium sp. JES 115]